MKKLRNIIYNIAPILSILAFVLVWDYFSQSGTFPNFVLPNPKEVFLALFNDFYLIKYHLVVTLIEALLGLMASILGAFLLSVLMDRYRTFHSALYPILILTQTIPTICIAPLIILWFGFGIVPKVVLVFITCLFPLLSSILNGFKNIDNEQINLLNSFNANYFQTLYYVKIPLSLKSFFSGLKVATTYSMIGAIIAEWLGGDRGLGVYMTRVRKSYSFDKMFAIIIMISFISILLVEIVKLLEKRIIKWEK